MEHAFLHKLATYLWRTLVTVTVLLALYVAVGRVLVGSVGAYRLAILEQINSRVPFTIEAQQVSGAWRSFSPELVLSALQLRLDEQPDIVFNLREGRVRLDLLGSLLSANLRLSHLQLDGLQLPLAMSADGRLHLAGFSPSDSELGDWVEQLVLKIEHFSLSDNQLAISLPNGEQHSLTLNLSLSRDGSLRQVQGSLYEAVSDTTVDLAARTLGNPFALDTLEAELYMRADQLQLDRLSAWFPAWQAPAAVSGRVHLETWLNWRAGEPHVETRLRGRELSVWAVDHRWQFPLDRLEFSATLQRQESSWTVFTRELALQRGAIELDVPSLQLDVWGDSLRLRGKQVSLAPISALLADFEKTPTGLADALRVLDASAQLRRVEFSLDDVQAPGRAWQLSANFSDFNATSWHGAPGIRSAEGYVSLRPGQGQVILDSQRFAMYFPTVYDHPLEYDDLAGSIDISWDEQGLQLNSGLISAQAEEGMSRALFALNVPFTKTDAGIEMDLLVGLQDSEAGYRHKYLPSVLNPQLLAWLRDSLGEGAVQQGAFLWRGSLKPSAHELRTLQLFFDVNDTALSYHSDWPALDDLQGLILIDDSNVSVWADSAKLYQSELSDISAEAWMSPESGMQLAVSATMQGSTEDALRLVKSSPLAAMTGHVFDNWSGAGQLATDLALELALNDKNVAPLVAVTVALQQGELNMQPLKLQLDNIQGQVSYHSQRGFSSQDLSAQLWQQAVSANFSSPALEPDAQPLAEGLASSLRIDFKGQLPAQPLQSWLGLEAASLVSGSSPATASLEVIPGRRAQFHLASELQGWTVKLPPPLSKAKEEDLALQVDLDLTALPYSLEIELERRLHATLLVGAKGALSGGHIALQDRAPLPSVGLFELSGQLAYLDPLAWRDLLLPLWPAKKEVAVEANNVGLLFEVDDLLAETLLVEGMELSQVMLNARIEPSGEWTVAAETDWLQGSLQLEAGLDRGSLVLDYLELDGLSGLSGDRESAAEAVELPELSVSVAELLKGGRSLGHLQFQLNSSAGTLRAATITGVIAGLTLAKERPGELEWQQGAAGLTKLVAPLQFDDLGVVLEELGYERILETELGRMDLALEWSGGPQDFSLLVVDGDLDLAIDSGRFLDAPASASGTLRVVSILNLSQILQRLSLTQVFESGIPFDRVRGEVLFRHGTIVVPSITVEGAASHFLFSGESPLKERTLDGELVATLPVASNLPWVAALTAGLPVAAGVYVVSRVFEKQMNRMSSAVYRLEGSWDEPQLSLSRIFDSGGRAEEQKEQREQSEEQDKLEQGPAEQDRNEQDKLRQDRAESALESESAEPEQQIPAPQVLESETGQAQ